MIGTDPRKADTDGDGPDDKWELERGSPPDIPALPPILADSDGDGVADKWETVLGTATNAVTADWPCADSDGDGFVDYYETHYLNSDAADWSDPPGTNTYDAAVMLCAIDSSLPCVLVVAMSNAVVKIPWLPGISPSVQKVYVPGGGDVTVRLARDFADESAESAGLRGYWNASLGLCDAFSGEEPDAVGGPFGPLYARPTERHSLGWIVPGSPVSNEWELKYRRLKFADEVIDFCGGLVAAWLWLDPSSDCGETPRWHSVPPGIGGTGNPLFFNPSSLPAGTYTVYATTADNSPYVRASVTVNIRRLFIAGGHEVINVDAADTTSHTITLGEGSYSPDGYTVTSEPAGIDDLTFIPADLDPGVAYHVRIFNGWCGYADVTVNNLTLVSETEAEWPADRTRTDIGVGEVVKLSVSPDMVNVSWSCDSNNSHLTSTGTVALVAGEIQETVSVTATIPDLSLSKTFSVLTPTDFCYSCPWYEVQYSMGTAGAGAVLNVTIAPTNVSFKNIFVTEGYSEANVFPGWFATHDNYAPAHNQQLGQNSQPVDSRNVFGDVITSDVFPYPWGSGYMYWDIPIRWFLPPSGSVTNFHEFAFASTMQDFTIEEDGTVEVSKFGSTVRRSPNSRAVRTDSTGEVVQ